MGKTSSRVNHIFDLRNSKQNLLNTEERKTILKHKRQSFADAIHDDEMFDQFLPPDTKEEIDPEILLKYLK